MSHAQYTWSSFYIHHDEDHDDYPLQTGELSVVPPAGLCLPQVGHLVLPRTQVGEIAGAVPVIFVIVLVIIISCLCLLSSYDVYFQLKPLVAILYMTVFCAVSPIGELERC